MKKKIIYDREEKELFTVRNFEEFVDECEERTLSEITNLGTWSDLEIKMMKVEVELGMFKMEEWRE